MNTRVLEATVNTYIGSLFIFVFGLLVLTIGFKWQHMEDPIANALAQQEAAVMQ